MLVLLRILYSYLSPGQPKTPESSQRTSWPRKLVAKSTQAARAQTAAAGHATLLISHQPPPTPLTIQANPPNTKKNPRPPAPSPAVSLHRRRHHLVLPLPSYRGMEHDAHAVPPSEDATVDDWARDDAEPMSVESGVAPAEVAAADSGADAPFAPSPSPSAAVAAEGSLLGPAYLYLLLVLLYSLFA
jgi:peptide chain release factor subunit 3